MQSALSRWHEFTISRNADELNSLLSDEVCFHSPVVHRPQPGKELCFGYLMAAMQVLGNDNFEYVREVVGPNEAALEFKTVVDGIEINGVDLIRWNDEQQIVDFKVMIRPVKALNLVHQLMARQLGISTEA